MELGRRLSPIGTFEPEQVDGVAGAYAHPVGGARRELGIEVEVAALCVIKELEIAKQRYGRPAILYIQNLAPAVVADDKIRGEAGALQLLADSRDGKASFDGGVEFLDVWVGAGRPPRGRVDDLANALQLPVAGLRDKDDLIARRREMSGGVDELAGANSDG